MMAVSSGFLGIITSPTLFLDSITGYHIAVNIQGVVSNWTWLKNQLYSWINSSWLMEGVIFLKKQLSGRFFSTAKFGLIEKVMWGGENRSNPTPLTNLQFIFTIRYPNFVNFFNVWAHKWSLKYTHHHEHKILQMFVKRVLKESKYPFGTKGHSHRQYLFQYCRSCHTRSLRCAYLLLF